MHKADTATAPNLLRKKLLKKYAETMNKLL